jgi:hypothetical protein
MTGLKGESTIGFVISYVVEICRGLNTLIFWITDWIQIQV